MQTQKREGRSGERGELAMGQWCDGAEIRSHGEEAGYSSRGSGEGPWRGQALIWNIEGAGLYEGGASERAGPGPSTLEKARLWKGGTRAPSGRAGRSRKRQWWGRSRSGDWRRGRGPGQGSSCAEGTWESVRGRGLLQRESCSETPAGVGPGLLTQTLRTPRAGSEARPAHATEAAWRVFAAPGSTRRGNAATFVHV